MQNKHEADPFFSKMVSNIASGLITSGATLLNGKWDRDHATQLEEKRQYLQRQLVTQDAQQHQEKLAWEAELAACNRQIQLEIAHIQRGTALEVARMQGSTAIEVAHIQKETALEAARMQGRTAAEIAELQIESAIQLAHIQHEYTLALANYNFMLERWPLHKLPVQILGNDYQVNNLKARHLKIFIVPPRVTDTPHEPYPFSIDEKILIVGIRSFLEKAYPYESPNRPTRLLDGAWQKPEYRGNASIEVIHTMLKSESVLILEPDVVENDLILRVAYWGLAQDEFLSIQIRSELQFHKISSEDSRIINRAFMKLLCFIASWFIDAHYLIHSEHPQDVPPLLPKMLPTLLDEHFSKEVVQPHLAEYIAKYQSVFEALKQEQPDIVPLLALQLAEALCHLPDKMLAREYILYSLQTYVEVLGISNVYDSVPSLLKVVFSLQDMKYIAKLKHCLIQFADTQWLELFNNLEASQRHDLLSGKLPRDEKGKTLYDLF